MKQYIQLLLAILTLINIHAYGMELVTQPTTEKMIEKWTTVDQMIEALENRWAITLEKSAQEKQPPHEICVPLWNYNSITSTSNMQNSSSISAFNLGNNIATALYVKYNNEDQYAGIAHYSNLSFKKHSEAIKLLCAEAINAQHTEKKITKVNFFIVKSAKYEYNKKIKLIVPDEDNAYYPSNPLEHPLEYYAKKIFEKIKKVKTTSIFYDISKDTVEYPRIVKITLYSQKASIMTHNEKNKPVLTLL
jgi:hypothetical protein